jgi:lycopene cyclase domain-containing protein
MLHFSYFVWISVFLITPLMVMWLFFHNLLARYWHIFLVNGLLMTLGLLWDNWGAYKQLWTFPVMSNTGHFVGWLPAEEYLAFGILFTFFVTSLSIIVYNYSEIKR